MTTTKQMNIKKQNLFFYNDLINSKDFDPDFEPKLRQKNINESWYLLHWLYHKRT